MNTFSLGIFVFFSALFIFLSGCTTLNNINNLSNSGDINLADVPSYSNTSDEIKCINFTSCSLEKKYINALGQQCMVLISEKSEKLAYCQEQKEFWHEIKIL